MKIYSVLLHIFITNFVKSWQTLDNLVSPYSDTCETGKCDFAKSNLPPRLNNIGYVGKSYDLFKGNPHSTGENVGDPGFESTKNMYEFTYLNNLTTTDGSYLIPDGTTVNNIESCSFTFSSSVTKDSSTYSDSLKVNVDAQFKYYGASFSASVDYQSVHQETSSGENVYISSHAECETYGASIDDAVLSSDFVQQVDSLPVSGSTSQYDTLIREWGTHVATSLIMGGRYGSRSKFTTTSYNDLSSQNFNIKAAGGYSGLVSVDASAATDTEKEQAETFNNNRQSVETYIVGGDPSNASVYEWAATVKESPFPLSYTLLDIYKFLNKYNFPNDTNIDQKRELLREAVGRYCMNTVPNTALCEEDYGPKSTRDRFRAFFVNDISYSAAGDRSLMQYSSDPMIWKFGDILGAFGEYANVSIVMVDIRSITPNLSVPATGIYFGGPFSSFGRFVCPPNYQSLTDIETWNGHDTANTSFNAPTVACVSEDCLSHCSRGNLCRSHLDNSTIADCYQIGQSFPQLGNDNNYGFFRDLTITDDPTPEADLFQCLTYECLEVVDA